MDFKNILEKGYLILDGAMGTMLQKRGLNVGEIPELLNIQKPDILFDIHMEYIKSGAMVVSANTFGANCLKLEGTGFSVEETITSGIHIAKDAVAQSRLECFVALDLGPIGEMLEPVGSLTFETAYEIYKEQVLAGTKAGADIIIIETMTDLYELRSALLAAKENSNLPVICTMTFEKNGRTFTGCDIKSMAITLEALGADAIGINCSLGPNEILPMAKELLINTSLPVSVKPNAGLPNLNSNEYDIKSSEFSESILQLAEAGVKIVGGCCGTTPEYIAEIATLLKDKKPPQVEVELHCAVCSSSKTVEIDGVTIIGERINPTGKKLLKEALKNENVDYILTQALQQINAGAHILDVNVGLPEIDEKRVMCHIIKSLQAVVDTPLQIDSSDPEVIEAALRVYNGKPIVNSVNGEDDVLDCILPIVKKYGAAVVGLTLDKNGIPPKAEQRFEIAEKILNRALSYGIPAKDVFIDCLTLTASAEQEAVVETLKAVRMVKEKLGLKTVLGVSNISFGLPNRELVNQSFLTLAMGHGLDLPIINPNISTMTDAINAFNLLYNKDKDAKQFVKAYAGVSSSSVQKTELNTIGQIDDIGYAVENGLKEDAARLARELLKTMEPMELVNTMLIPALDRVGEAFGKGELFLPQLIQGAQAVEAAFDIIKKSITATPVSKGKIVLATVKGDIHDIGKNIVKVLLENYGFTVIDLGRDVDHKDVVDAVLRHKVKLVGLSALMTTTLKNMEETIRQLKASGADCKIVVGGAVLTADYAEKMGADFYAEDAKQTVDIAKRIFAE